MLREITSRKDKHLIFFFLLFLLSTYKILNEWINNTYFDESNVKHTKHCTLKMSLAFFSKLITLEMRFTILLVLVSIIHFVLQVKILFLKEQHFTFHVKVFCCLVFYDRNVPQKSPQRDVEDLRPWESWGETGRYR